MEDWTMIADVYSRERVIVDLFVKFLLKRQQ